MNLEDWDPDFSGEFTVVNNNYKLERFIERLREEYDKHKYLRIKTVPGKARTDKQNRALYKFFSMLADDFNARGLEQRVILQDYGIPVPWDKDSVRKILWLPIQKAMFETERTRDLERTELNKVYEKLMKWCGEQHGVYVEFPHEDAEQT